MLLNFNLKPTDELTALRPLFEEYLRCALWCEEHLMPLYAELSDAISSPIVRDRIERHAGQTTNQYRRLIDIFESIGIKAESHRFEVLKKHLFNVQQTLRTIPIGAVRDAAIIAELQQISHCEIACYGTLRSFAIALKEEKVVWLLEENLDEEKAFDNDLSSIANASVNDEAANIEY